LWRCWLPNLLTSARLGAAIAFPVVPAEWWLSLTVYAAVSDLVDGWLSRRWGSTSVIGQLLDPIADKAFLFAAAGTLTVARLITPWELLAVASRDIAVLLLTALAAWSVRLVAEDVRPRWSGKVATAGQLTLLLALAAWRQPQPALVLVAAGLSLLSAVDYAQYAVQRLLRSG